MKKLRLKEVIEKINFYDKKIQSDIDWEDLGNALNIQNFYYHYFEQDRLKAYFIQKWYCTDSYVGVRAYFFDNKFIALSTQFGRKFDEDFEFVSIEDAENLKKYIQSLINEEEDDTVFSILETDLEFDEFYSIEYNTQISHKNAIYYGHNVEILETNFKSEGISSPNYFHSVEIKFEDGRKDIVDCRQLLFSRFSLD